MERMIRVRGNGLLALALIATLGLVGCGDPEEEARLAKEAAETEAWSVIETAKSALDAQRQELSGLQARITEAAAEGSEAAAEGSEAAQEAVATLETQAEELVAKITTGRDELTTLAIHFINEAGLNEGEEVPERVQTAIRLKTAGDMSIAREYIDEAGDYGRALEIYRTALDHDPDSQQLQEAIASAEDLRWMTEERFTMATKGMTVDEVTAVLGPVNQRRIQDYPEKKITAWYYPKGPDLGAAGVFLQQKGEGEYKVYKLDFNAAKPTKTQ